jgi:hypothetical protein
MVIVLSVGFAATQAWAAGSAVRHDVVLAEAECGHGSVTLSDRGKLFSGAYAVCGRETLTFLWRPEAGNLSLSTTGGARLGHVSVNLAKGTWSADAIFLPILSSSWGREINLITQVLPKARPRLGKALRSPRSEFTQDPGEDPWPGGGENDPDCMGHYMTHGRRYCSNTCADVWWFWADSTKAGYSQGYKPNGTNACGCTQEISCPNG